MPDPSSPSQVVIRHMKRLATATIDAAHKDGTVRTYVEDETLSNDLELIVPLWIPLGIVRDLIRYMPDVPEQE